MGQACHHVLWPFDGWCGHVIGCGRDHGEGRRCITQYGSRWKYRWRCCYHRQLGHFGQAICFSVALVDHVVGRHGQNWRGRLRRGGWVLARQHDCWWCAGFGRGDGFVCDHLDRLVANEQCRRCDHAGSNESGKGSAKDQGGFDRDLHRALAGQEQETRFLQKPVPAPDHHRAVWAVAAQHWRSEASQDLAE